uniref:Rep_3 domain-containing protein n=1 Tax=Strongyloides papillosus TaxID=174720 RepID=A0A0N5CGM2_STREA
MSFDVKPEFKLTHDFLQLLAEDRNFSLKPLVQILGSQLTDDPSSIRIHVSDGSSIYSHIYLMRRALEKFYYYKMDKHKSIIKILDYQYTKTSREGINKIGLTIYDFELIEKKSPIIGNPRNYLGNSEQRLALEVNKAGQIPLKRLRLSIPTGKRL